MQDVNMKKNNITPFILTIFGASGDLAKLKIFPEFYDVFVQGKFPKKFAIFGYARTEMTREEFQQVFAESVREHVEAVDEEKLSKLLEHVYYYSGQYDQLEDFNRFRDYILDECKVDCTKVPHVAYLSVPPVVFEDVIKNLAEARASQDEDIRLVVEKPFGESKKTAEELFHFVSNYFDEDQFYLLDHYLGKTSVRSILHLRHSNRILAHMMQGSEVANIQITKFEDFGVKHRAGYFDKVGIVEDMMQSHLLQILALVTMSVPVKMDAKSLQQEKYNILSAIDCPCDEKNVVLGQYKSYRKEGGVADDSQTETFAAIRLFLNRQDWYETPIYMRTGKKLNEDHTYVVIELKRFEFQPEDEEPNRVIIELIPEERINITLINKQEDVSQTQSIVTTDSIACDAEGCLPEHAVLLLDVLNKEKMHFLSFAEIIAQWEVIDQISELVAKHRVHIELYKDGSSGPESQNKLTDADGFAWYDVHPEVKNT